MYVTPCLACGVRPPPKTQGKKTPGNKAGKKSTKNRKNLKIGIDLMTYAFLK
jgi:hypothetical protein